MKIKYNSLHMQNFKCYKDKTIKFGDITKISGRNGIGKSSIADAIAWVLFDRMADGTKADKIRPHDANGNDIPMIDIVVELDMEVDGKPINIVKTQKQKWVKPRGKQEQKFSGNENSYVVNTIPKTEKDYKSYIAEFISDDLFKLTSSAELFLKKKTAEKRDVLFTFISDMTDDDVINTNPKFTPLSAELEKYKLEEIISRAKKAIKDYNEELDTIPASINAVDKMRVDVDVAELELKKNSLNEQIADIDSKLADVTKDNTIGELSSAIMKAQFDISDYERKANKKLFEKHKVAQRVVAVLEDKAATLLRQRGVLNGKISSLDEQIKSDTLLITNISESYKSKQAEEFDESVWVFNENDTVCPNCGRSYEEDKIAEIKASFNERKQKAIDDFNSDKKNILAKINERGKALNATIKANKAMLAEKQAEFENIKTAYDETIMQKNTAVKTRSELPDNVDLSADQEYARLNDVLANLNNQYEAAKNIENPTKELEAQKSALQKELMETQTAIASADNSKIDEEIAKYKARQSELSQLVANAEKELDLYEDFNRAKMKLLTDRINEHFSVVKFELFENQINGGYKEICEPTVNGTYYSNGLNAGHKILVELDIVSTLQKTNGVSCPVFCDNAERLSSDTLNGVHMDCQMIYLRVSDSNELVVESEEK